MNIKGTIYDYYIIESLPKYHLNDGLIIFDLLKSIEGFNRTYITVTNFIELKEARIKNCSNLKNYCFESSK